MSWEQPVYSFNYGQPPTPTRTPTSATFGQTPFQTPKAESSFYDPRVTWNTADPYAASPNLPKTPQQLTFTTPTVKRPSTALGLERALSSKEIAAEIASHVHHPSPNPSLPLPPVELSRQLSSSPNPASAKRVCSEVAHNASSPKFGLALDTVPAMRPAGSMQTPPPTSTSASRRKTQKAQAAKFGQQSTATLRRQSVPEFTSSAECGETASAQPEASPLQFSGIQFSPDGFSFPLLGPATAPAYPQHKLFWDPGESDGMDIDFSRNLEDPFNTDSRSTLDPFISVHDQSFASQVSMPSSFLNFPLDGPLDVLATGSSSNKQAKLAPAKGSLRKKSSRTTSTAAGVNPSLLFSSPGRLLEPLNGSTAATQIDEDALQPYAYQIQEAKREKATGGASTIRKKRKPVDDSPAVKAALEALREDDANQSPPKRNKPEPVTTRSSHRLPQSSRIPLKLRRGSSSPTKGSKENARRTAVSLTIDASGRARTEARTIIDDQKSLLDDDRAALDSQSDGSDSETSSGNSMLAITTSQAPSFDFTATKIRQPKIGRFATNPRSHSQKSSSTTVYTSGSYTDDMSGIFDENGSAGASRTLSGNQQSRRGSRKIRTLLLSPDDINGHADKDEMSGAETVMGSEDHKGTAQYELKKLLRDRAKDTPIGFIKHRDPKNGNTSKNRLLSAYGANAIHTVSYNQHTISSTSPTTITDPDLASSNSHAHESVRCVCLAPSNDGQMINCESCKKWLHFKCVGLNLQQIPSTFLCVFCTGQTPLVRGVRDREPSRVGFAPPCSPLAQMSHRFQ